MNIHGDGVEGIHGVGEADEPVLCPCGKGYIGHAGPDTEAHLLRRRRESDADGLYGGDQITESEQRLFDGNR